MTGSCLTYPVLALALATWKGKTCESPTRVPPPLTVDSSPLDSPCVNGRHCVDKSQTKLFKTVWDMDVIKRAEYSTNLTPHSDQSSTRLAYTSYIP